jgi:hypothetical protein
MVYWNYNLSIMVDGLNGIAVWSEIPEGHRPLRRLRNRGEDSIKINLGEMG